MAVPRLGAFFFVAAGLVFGESWLGALVDAKCWAAMERDVGPTDSLINVDRDRGEEVRYCSPSAKTKSFEVVSQNNAIFELDAGGSAQASDVIHKAGKRPLYMVDVSGQKTKNTVPVSSITLIQ